MPARRSERDTAKAEYIDRKSKGEKVNLRELAEKLGVSYQTLRNWKAADKWDDSLPKKRRGGQPGNKNSKGRRNAAGSHKGAPLRNKNAEKDGAYSAVFFDRLTEEERNLVEQTPLGVREAFEDEMKVLKFRENKILSKIADYESAEEGTMYLNTMTEIHGKNDTTMRFSDSAFKRVQSLQEALYKVQGRIAKIADSLRALEESERRMGLEQERLEILRMRATGAVNTDPPEGAGDAILPEGMEVEDATLPEGMEAEGKA